MFSSRLLGNNGVFTAELYAVYRVLLRIYLGKMNGPRAVESSIEVWQSSVCSIGKEEILLSHLRTGHTRLTQGHLLRGDAAHLYVHCGLALNISSIFLECPHYDEGRHTFHLQGALQDIVGDNRSKVSNVVAFLHTTAGVA